MRTWVWTLLLLGVAVALAVAARDHAGNVVLLAPPYRIEVSLVFAVSTLILLFVALHLLLRLAGWTFGVGQRVRVWWHQRELAREHERLEHGWIQLLQGHYLRAEHDFDGVSRRTRVPERQVLAQLSLARAAHAMRQYARADAALVAARSAAGSRDELLLAVACTAADLFLAQGRANEALEALEPVSTSARHTHVQRLLLRVYVALCQWRPALKLARGLNRQPATDPELASVLEHVAANGLLAAPDLAARRQAWKELKASERVMPAVALAAANAFAQDPAEVRAILRAALDVQLDPRLLTAFAQCEQAEVRPRLQAAESWLQKHPEHPELLRMLGDLCLRGQLWGPATAYLQRSLKQREDPRTHALLGSLYDHLDRPADASRHWREATATLVGLTVLDRSGALPAAEMHADPLRLDAEAHDFERLESETSAGLPVIEQTSLAADDEHADAQHLGAADVPPVADVVDVVAAEPVSDKTAQSST